METDGQKEADCGENSKKPKQNLCKITEPHKIKNLYHYNPAEKSARRAVTPSGFANAFFEANR